MNTDLISWMAWTWPTAAFFAFILLCLIGMTVWDYYAPGGASRHDVLGIDTTRGDRCFISLLGSAYILLLWLAFFDAPLWIAGAICVIFALAVFRWV